MQRNIDKPYKICYFKTKLFEPFRKEVLVKNPNFAVFGVVEMPNGEIVLVQERGNFPTKKWKLPGGRPKPDNEKHEQMPEYVLLREINDEIGLIVEVDECIFLTQSFKRSSDSLYTLDSHNFIVYACRYYSGELRPGAEIECCKAFSKMKF